MSEHTREWLEGALEALERREIAEENNRAFEKALSYVGKWDHPTSKKKAKKKQTGRRR